jgi:hypothetical protein
MDTESSRNSATEFDIDGLARNLREITLHDLSEETWASLQRGEYLGVRTENQEIKRGPGGIGLLCDRLSPQDWAELRGEAERSRLHRTFNRQFQELEEEMRDGYLHVVLPRCFPELTASERRALADELDRFSRAEAWAAMEEFLTELCAHGLKKIKRRQRWGRQALYWKSGLRVVGALIEIAIAWGIYGICETNYQRAMFCLLLLAYCRIASMSLLSGVGHVELFLSIDRQFSHAFKLLRDQPVNVWARDESLFKVSKKSIRPFVFVAIADIKHILLCGGALCGLIASVL